MASFPVEVIHTGKWISEAYYDNNGLNFAVAKIFSQSPNHFKIIDSYSSVGGVGRYKGDPIADGVWETASDVGENQDWFIVECQSELPALAAMGYSGLPKWQMKIQWVTRYLYLYDVSDPTGVKYPKNHGMQYYTCVRFGPYGGWDKADSLPDFNPISPPASGDVSTQNHRDHHWVGSWITGILADGCAIVINHAQGGRYVTPMILAGDVIPPTKDHMPMPRAMLNSGNAVENLDYAGFLAEDGAWTNGGANWETSDGAGGGVSFWDHNENVVQKPYQTQRCRSLAKKQGNHHSSNMEIDTFPYIVIPNVAGYGARFALGHVRKGWGKGYMTIQNKTLMTGDNGWTAVFPWDGSSSIMR